MPEEFTSKMPVRQSKQPDERRDDILRAARELVAESGVARVSITDIAARVGVTRGLIYHYFPDKEAIIDLICEDHIAEFVADLDRWDAARIPGDIDRALVDCVALFRHHLHRTDLFREELGRTEYAGLYNEFVDRAVMAVVDRLQVTTVEAYARRHQIRIDNVAEVFYVLVFGLIGLVRSKPAVTDEVLVAIVRQTLHLERTAPASPSPSNPKE
ncbi:TetR/AcrR family transcriptional regulator [Cryobacterium cheniae]|uniref:TetR/AcrR family transcriptional regulator n=1 Tax=Cryobacterium cheniae TaxID=1259262 RepID=A0A4R8XYR6_9MICO|nr:TetR/AcrR family transcriptional regulator [Cryobacterium cheniae]TFC82974.1 TetR/AcrR family transcriptional regulator [Cryobacterium cheniae]